MYIPIHQRDQRLCGLISCFQSEGTRRTRRQQTSLFTQVRMHKVNGHMRSGRGLLRIRRDGRMMYAFIYQLLFRNFLERVCLVYFAAISAMTSLSSGPSNRSMTSNTCFATKNERIGRGAWRRQERIGRGRVLVGVVHDDRSWQRVAAERRDRARRARHCNVITCDRHGVCRCAARSRSARVFGL